MNFARFSRVRADDTYSKITGSSGWTTGTASSGNSRTSGLKNEVILGRDCIDVTSYCPGRSALAKQTSSHSNFFFRYISCCGSLKLDTNTKIRNKLSPICIVELRRGAMNIISSETLNASQTASTLPSEIFSLFTFAVFFTNSKKSSNVHSGIRLAIEKRWGRNSVNFKVEPVLLGCRLGGRNKDRIQVILGFT